MTTSLGRSLVIRQFQDSPEELTRFISDMEDCQDSQRDILLNYPVVYIHKWEDKGVYSVYVGEANHFVRRTQEHYRLRSNDKSWQSRIPEQAKLFVIAHPHFNKSLTLDIENRMIEYMMTMPNVTSLNQRSNPQDSYYPEEELGDIFSAIWTRLRRFDPKLFISPAEIEKSAVFKASPLHKLTERQKNAKARMLDVVAEVAKSEQRGQLILVEGSAGTGKTVLMSSTFYELCVQSGSVEDKQENSLRCCLLVNHAEQLGVYRQIAKQLGLNPSETVFKPTSFINRTDPAKPVDVAFIDEAHLLLTQGRQSYQGRNQLNDIRERARVTVAVFDPHQVLTTEQYISAHEISRLREQCNAQIILDEQLRMKASPAVQNWIDSFVRLGKVLPLPQAVSSRYEIRVFSSAQELDNAIREKAQHPETALSRLIATYDWAYKSGKDNPDDPRKLWQVRIGQWQRPWNYELEYKELTRRDRQFIKGLAWAEQPQTLHEVGSTFTIQGFDLNYAGVILGPSVRFEDGKVVLHPESSCNDKATRQRTLSDGTKRSFSEDFLKNEINVLLTRGVNGLFIYAVDDALREKLLSCQD